MSIQLSVNPLVGSKVGKVSLSDSTFGATFNEALIHQVVTAYQAGGRSGTRAQKNRAAVRGGGAKPWRQKGTGRARAGTIRSPIFTGGGRAFPASTHDFSQKVNRKMYRAAMRSILSELNRQGRLVVVDDLAMDTPKTKNLVATLNKLDARQSLLVLLESNENVALSARNIKSISVCNGAEINPVDLIRFEKVVMTEAAVKSIDEALQ